ncbi:hypothetical protein HaLaN_19121 [Haematococcus lacustris]|uniref:Uncharacterized protein n=1 Tax=Haematococcus lacustris TaxID=44745 RepID=A0A699ZG92_HAELA|nr:hypothetical protein HaLaN_19121 [Haematococcus lacustris]
MGVKHVATCGLTGRAWQPGDELRITLAGADRNEGVTPAETALRFAELARCCAAAGVGRLRLLLCGPGPSLLPPLLLLGGAASGRGW